MMKVIKYNNIQGVTKKHDFLLRAFTRGKLKAIMQVLFYEPVSPRTEFEGPHVSGPELGRILMTKALTVWQYWESMLKIKLDVRPCILDILPDTC